MKKFAIFALVIFALFIKNLDAKTLAYVFDFSTLSIKVYDVQTKVQVDEIPIGHAVNFITMRPGDQEIWASAEATDNIYVIDIFTKSIVKTFNLGLQVGKITFSQDGNFAFTASSSGSFTSGQALKIDANLHTLVFSTPVGVSPRDNLLSPDGSRLYVGNHRGSIDVNVINTSNGSTIQNVNYGGFKPQNLELSENGDKIYVANSGSGGQNTITILSTLDFSILATIHLPKQPIYLKLLESKNLLYCYSNDHPHDVYAIDLTTNNIIDIIYSGPGGGHGMLDLTPDLQELWIVDHNSDILRIVDTNSNAVKDTIGPGFFIWMGFGESLSQPPTASAGPDSTYECTTPSGTEVTLNALCLLRSRQRSPHLRLARERVYHCRTNSKSNFRRYA